MNIDNKFSFFKGHLSDFRFSTKNSKTALGQTMVTSTEQKSVAMDLKSDEKSHHKQDQKKSEAPETKEEINKSPDKQLPHLKQMDAKKLNLKLLNLL